MYQSAKSKAEQRFAATQKKYTQAVKEKERVRQEKAELVARLRALRLAKEAADAADKDVAGKEAAKNKKPAPSNKDRSRQS